MSEIGKNISYAAELLNAGKLVAIPTETVYGLAALATNQEAVLSVFEAKNRPSFDPLILHFDSIESIKAYADLSDPRLLKLARQFWPGPLSLLLPKTKLVPDIVTSGLDSVAVRIPRHPFTLEVLRKLKAPVAAPSANPFGYISPTRPEHVQKQLGEKVAYILDGGSASVGLESTIVGIENDKICLYRLGGLSIEDLEEFCEKIELRLNASSNPRAPGQLKSHYAPKKPLRFGDLAHLIQENQNKKLSLLTFSDTQIASRANDRVFNLSPTGDFKEAAVNLFAMLREADQNETELILAQKLPEIGLGRAINDRLQRAATESF